MGNIYFITGFPGFISNQLIRELLERDLSFEKAYFLVLSAQREAALQAALSEGIQPMVGFYSQNRHNPAYQIHIL
ncbi:SDR family oxidoreductase [Peribacillus sp. SCS-37]|uniref:SDR family oxidoreductase n=1 Tax=Paraperibacillus esterisolvens TaxID=3115296 RepID=UPI003906405D